MDSLTAHYLARELDARWRARHVDTCALDRTKRTVTLAVTGAGVVEINLAAPDVRVVERAERPARGTLDGWTITGVGAPVDDRRLEIRFEKPGKFRGSIARRATLDVSLVPSARGAVLRAESGRVLASVGQKLPPPATPRPVLASADVEHAARRGDQDALLAGRWMSPRAARWLLEAPDQAVSRYSEICDLPPARPSRCGDAVLPLALCVDAQPVPSLIEPEPRATEPWRAPPATQRQRALARMRQELERAHRAPFLRTAADKLIALGDVPCPATIDLQDGTVIPLDAQPGATAVEMAERLYGEARSMERALARLPARIAALEAGDAPGRPGRPPRRTSTRAATARKLPFRTYRSSGGLDIWVGRGAASNDALTFDEASPADVWLHARSAAGAHVVLRWQRDEAPPARDLEEAAQLAAWHSKARGSTVVPVDWTRKKYVRKPRGGAPGVALVSRAKTLFVRPSAEVERRLRAPE
ncbi:MAG TPA: NFACT RNA binding domain-containing protein [Gemmatimonadaceae bacterium]|nr:NFACT RNA binding domain-containing protein [Gemmatimonadaceae bacterium]